MNTRATPGRKLPVLPLVLGAIAVLGLIAVLVAVVGGGEDSADVEAGVEQTRPVDVGGSALPPLESPEDDPAVGQQAPSVEGQSFDGSGVTIAPGAEGPTLLIFVAHWCPHCQAEVPVITDWLADRGEPEGVELLAVSTSVDPDLPNFPPSTWLEEEDWPVPTLADDADGSAAAAYGVSSYPFFVGIDADGEVAVRGSGELSPDELDQLIAALS